MTPSATPAPTADADLLRRLHDEHAAALWRFVVGLLGGDGAAAQDVVQETLVRAWTHPDALDPETGSVRGWLFTVARRIVLDQRRHQRRHPEVVTAQLPEPAPARDATGALADREAILAALRSLSVEHRAVLLECYFRGASVSEAAVTLGIPQGTVKSRTHYALRALRATLLESGGWA